MNDEERKLEADAMNPKDALGMAKNPHCCVPLTVLAELGVAMMEGSRKYGRHNYRVSKIKASVYYDAARRHLDAWWEGEDIDPESGIHHVVKAIAGLAVCRDAEIHGKLHDDRPPRTPPEFYKHLTEITAGVIEKYPKCVEPYVYKKTEVKMIPCERCKGRGTFRGITCGMCEGYGELKDETN
ncbi:dATP/dGTP diphosphohydrolase domain-containing protein [Neptuniibacter sp.]|uniref:dATP/dGTP diphosphohydrolase domain-containing protein n=1 Tax=Neptuniibacter sp. TaxID=1962643 RepID=UPI00261E7B9D|nr:dATP/dGTP diphosphohydrolase domain-containing protein [Neptuniibacter sp.]MCP4596235.1 hypothetical protein [Neptuniibacter sp.]